MRGSMRGDADMRFQITGQGWPVGQFLIPSGSIIDASADHWPALFARGLKIPITATPLDTEAFEAQQAAHPEHKHLLGLKPTNKEET
jgi:hypothetical protein